MSTPNESKGTTGPPDVVRQRPSLYDRAYPPELRAAEVACLKLRRERSRTEGYTPVDPEVPGTIEELPPVRLPADAVGLALSGGGIRSATFCLGVMQALAAQGLLRRIDFLSTVSGGGYIGAFFGALVQRAVPIAPGGPTGINRAEADLGDPSSAPLRWLRENGRYMSPNGAGDEIAAGAVYLRNLCTIHVVMATTVVAILAGVMLTDLAIHEHVMAIPTLRTGGLAWSDAIWISLALLGLVAFPFGWGYWFIQRDKNRQVSDWMAAPTAFLVAVVSTSILARLWTWPPEGWAVWFAAFFSVTPCLALAAWGGALLLARRQPDAQGEVFTRAKMSQWLAVTLLAAAASAAFALVDSLGQALAESLPQGGPMVRGGGLAATIGALIAATSKLSPLLSGTGGKRLSVPKSVVAGIAATIVLGGILVSLATVTHLLVNGSLTRAGWLTATAAVLSLLFGLTVRFVNSSSHQAMYANRLIRAYLGASNPRRFSSDLTGRRLSDPIPGDNIGWGLYAPYASGGPLHVINVTLNETISGASQIEQRDRKGLPLAVGPCGVSGGVTSHALWKQLRETHHEPVEDWRGRLPGPSTDWLKSLAPAGQDFDVFAGVATNEHEVEALSVGTWTAISGAAFTTGLGARTNLALSMLLGLANVRLGYWWDSHVAPTDRNGVRAAPTLRHWAAEQLNAWFPVQVHLFQELTARFFGPHRRRWYLSDGGHFENTACYELLRRRVPFIIACDDGQDDGYVFEDLGNLVRKARLDFHADIRILSRSEIETRVHPSLHTIVGVLDDFRTKADGDHATGLERRFCGAHALLADVFYEGEKTPGTVILFLKPSLMGDESLDVLQYRQQHPAFPQEPTGDQYLDEAQWESYRALGEHVSAKVFRACRDGDGWAPSSMVKPA